MQFLMKNGTLMIFDKIIKQKSNLITAYGTHTQAVF